MTRLGDVVDKALLAEMLAERFVVARKHTTMPLVILNYTDRCQYERGAWNEVTRACRGLIYRVDTEAIMARPFRKFFNYGQAEAGTLDLKEPAVVTDKLDGSLGVLYPTNDGYAIATRGAFDSDQAIRATTIWQERYQDVQPDPDWTLLFEIIYPENRIVLDYGTREDLVLLGAVNKHSGQSVGPMEPEVASWPGPRATVFPYSSLADALAAPPRPNAEGLVVHLCGTDERVKIKQEDYVRLHRIVTGLNERTVWEHLSEGKPLRTLIEPLPDEFHRWVEEVADGLVATVNGWASDIELAYAATVASLPSSYSRKDFALAIKGHPQMAALFSRLDGKDYRPSLWRAAKPATFRGPTGQTYSEDTA